MEEKEYNIITLEDGKKYIEADKIDINNNTYLLLINDNDYKDFCIRKLTKENDTEYIVGLDSKEEFDKILGIFSKKYM